jgi:lysophospholipase L1-like esterase
MSKHDWVLASVAIILATAISLLLVRWLAPQLLGIPVDLQLVQTSKTLPPFFAGVFREEDAKAGGMLLNDPHTNTRFRPLLPADSGTGPHDVLGFRNTEVPNTANIVVIGDSQTYGVGEALEDNWPSQLQAMTPQQDDRVYSMAVGGWGAVQYLYMFDKATRLKPQVIIVAFYSGNDALDSFTTAYGNPHWQELMLDPALDKDDTPQVESMLDVDDAWPVTFSDGSKVAFTPVGRLAVNDREQVAVTTGYAIMAEVARRITIQAAAQDITVVFTTIPTRELVYAGRVSREALAAPAAYTRLIAMEQKNIDELARHIDALPRANHVDLVGPLQAAALENGALYPRLWDGHPGKQGYRVIADTLAAAINDL